mmetsp:Transcript_18407/g.25869  ORF Transcript_18407/g.25869 Transcript_18407/m.25869 type:complete len:102 (+) Transcript_18407:1288-1593(+)
MPVYSTPIAEPVRSVGASSAVSPAPLYGQSGQSGAQQIVSMENTITEQLPPPSYHAESVSQAMPAPYNDASAPPLEFPNNNGHAGAYGLKGDALDKECNPD